MQSIGFLGRSGAAAIGFMARQLPLRSTKMSERSMREIFESFLSMPRQTSNQSLQRTAGRSDVPDYFMRTHSLQSVLATASGR